MRGFLACTINFVISCWGQIRNFLTYFLGVLEAIDPPPPKKKPTHTDMPPPSQGYKMSQKLECHMFANFVSFFYTHFLLFSLSFPSFFFQILVRRRCPQKFWGVATPICPPPKCAPGTIPFKHESVIILRTL